MSRESLITDDSSLSSLITRHSSWSLRGRLIAAFAAIIFLTLLMVGVGFLFVFGQYRAQRELIRLATLVGPVTFQVRTLEQQGASAPEIVDFLARQSEDVDVRIVLARRDGAIFHDTAGTLVGQRIAVASAERLGQLRRANLLTVEGQPEGRIFFVAAATQPPNAGLAERFLGRPSAYLVALASEPLGARAALGEMAPRLLLAALVSLLASVGVAWLLAGSIARPLARMTRAAEEMARGRYDQEIPGRGADEIGRLAAAFNQMAREVARAHRALRDFLANVSHDLRTPLTSIQGFSQAMVDGALRGPDELAQAGRIVNEEAARMSRLVDALLELSRIESGQATLELAEIDLAGLARRAGERAARAAAEADVELVLDVRAAPAVRGDARHLERVLDNLLGNAIEHTPPRGRVTLGVERSGGGATSAGRPGVGASAVVRVHNTGSAIPPEDLPRIFERFYRVDRARGDGGAGRGLGLAIAREIVQAHGGRILAASSAAAGTTFTVLLPALDAVVTGPLGSRRRLGPLPSAAPLAAGRGQPPRTISTEEP